MVESLGQQGLFNIIISLLVLTVVWWALQAVKLDLFLKDPSGVKVKALLVLLTLAIAQLVTSFILNYLNWATMLRYLF